MQTAASSIVVKPNYLKQILKDNAAGFAAGAALVVTGHPLDTIKVRLQTCTPGQFIGLTDCVRQTFKKEGFSGFLKGIGPPLLGESILGLILFSAYASGLRFLKDRQDNDEALGISGFVYAGMYAGFVVAFVESPLELVKNKMQVRYTSSGSWAATGKTSWEIISRYGLRGIFQGLSSTFLRNLPANAGYFGTYEAIRRYISGDTNNTTLAPLSVLVAGGIAGFSYWLCSYPFDVIKSRIQTDASDPTLRKYKNTLDCTKQLYRAEGLRGFWRGFTPCLLSAFPANAACFFCYEV
eukprot:TRINITY_DN1473_c0_g1_i4.p1 TRINITY_DN1473_c0_g1~~TRINITY_DN1473_c0_g1_i4.p1  ORF type:complete len:295 (+),score=44.51 TRINITY_DN1473_c0_g1_i4:171-1055(+)